MADELGFDQELNQEEVEIYEEKLSIDFKEMTADQLCELGYLIEKGLEGRKKDLYLAYILYHLSAEKGSTFAFNNLGWMYEKGYGVAQDLDKAMFYYQVSASYYHTTAMLNIGSLYEDAKEYDDAYAWYLKAGLMGDLRGTYNVANMYYHGWYVEQDLKYAWELFKMLYDKEDKRIHGDCCFYLGLYEQNGYRGEVDYQKAAEYYMEGMGERSGICMTQLGVMYSDGLGVVKDEKKAFDLFVRATAYGDKLAYSNVGNCYERGQGVEKDKDLALTYYKKGYELGEENAIENFERLAEEAMD